MRPLHLLGLMPPGYRFHSPDGAPLMLPGSIPSGDHELLIAFFQQVITERPLPRVEVDGYTMLLDPSRRYLEHVLGERGSSGLLLVVKVRQPGVDLHEVAAHPVIRGFEHTALSSVHPGGTEDLRALLTLTRDVREQAESLYEATAGRLGLRQEGWRLIADFVRTLQSPIDVLETANALIEVQLEENPESEQRARILQRMLIRLLEWRPAGELAALVGLATRGVDATAALLRDESAPVLAGLKAQGLFRDGTVSAGGEAGARTGEPLAAGAARGRRDALRRGAHRFLACSGSIGARGGNARPCRIVLAAISPNCRVRKCIGNPTAKYSPPARRGAG
ncbi:hypothetical protein WMF31_24470 [Sorangium sp. So ce1036]|uniref:hypothetical protein n=1 Tax=Sorangium sp. So ce1036 TaxID=3133328 RepID=UPI003F071CCB